VTDPAASLTAEVAMAVFKTAFERWVSQPGGRDFARLIRDSLEELTALTASR